MVSGWNYFSITKDIVKDFRKGHFFVKLILNFQYFYSFLCFVHHKTQKKRKCNKGVLMWRADPSNNLLLLATQTIV